MDKQSLLNLIVDNMKEGIHVVDTNGKTLLYNKVMADVEGMDPDEVLNRQLLEVLPSLEGNSTLLKVLKTGKAITMNYQTYFNKDGKKITTLNSTWPIKRDKEIIGAVEIAKDISNIEKMIDSLLYSINYTDNNNKNYSNKTASYTFDDILGQSPEILNAKQIGYLASKTDSPVLIIGESGTGKELFAQSIHNASSRKNKPFIAENCAAIPENLLEGLLFGTSKGAFTGAINRSGLLEQAHGGTLLLDEINSMPLDLQAKFLRVLQESKFRPIGSTKEIKVDIRVISITSKDPIKLVKEGKLREDLFFRLSVVNIYLPPLRNRQGDIEILKNHFIKTFEEKFNKKIAGIDDEVEEFFKTYTWPGNIRELEHILEGVFNIIQENETIKMEHLPYYVKRDYSNYRNNEYVNPDKSIFSLDLMKRKDLTLNEYLNSIEEELIIEALKLNDYNITKTAQYLGIKRQGLQYKLKKMSLQKPTI
ncbi:MAG: sigma 54-interacting transcriptional regulator [Tissierellia bacterium]|nr:sigma 54-interacting transcriptional regulator [Tissierellia bacterium]